MAKTPEQWATELVEAFTHGTDTASRLPGWALKDLKEKALASFRLAQHQAYCRGLAARVNK